MKIVTAFDSFKGSASAADLCAAAARGVKRVYPEATVGEFPLADGGEGTAEQLIHATGGSWQQVTVSDPLGRPLASRYGILGDGQTAVIEVAEASGLSLLTEQERNPLITSSRGTGETIKLALDHGVRRFIIGLGGSATNDGGAGLMRALGMRFLDRQGVELSEGGGALQALGDLDGTALDVRLPECQFLVACDVTNILVGPQGASAVFGPQKGADAAAIAQLDAGLSRLAEVVLAQGGADMRTLQGGGAAGGIGAALSVWLRGEMRSGIALVMDTIGLEEALHAADFVIAGEGKLDEQTLAGKVLAGVCRLSAQQGIPVLAVCGGRELPADQMDELGIAAAFAAAPGPCTLQESMRQASNWVEETVVHMLRLIRATNYKPRHQRESPLR